MSAYLEPDPRGRDVPFLDSYATERWETVLHYMVASNQQAGISTDAVHTLLQVHTLGRCVGTVVHYTHCYRYTH